MNYIFAGIVLIPVCLFLYILGASIYIYFRKRNTNVLFMTPGFIVINLDDPQYDIEKAREQHTAESTHKKALEYEKRKHHIRQLMRERSRKATCPK
jgi:hypothetical protein